MTATTVCDRVGHPRRAVTFLAGLAVGLVACNRIAQRPVPPPGRTSNANEACGAVTDNIVAMWNADQAVMLRMMEVAKQGEVDGRTLKALEQSASEVTVQNTTKMRVLVHECGWPAISKVGAQTAHAAWGIVQHADHDPLFQRKCLDLMVSLLPTKDVGASDVALLTDRVLRAEGRLQRYGTQVTYVDGQALAPNLEDPDDVDHRRAKMGLPPLKEYLESMQQFQATIVEAAAEE